MDIGLKDRVVVVTVGSSGIGLRVPCRKGGSMLNAHAGAPDGVGAGVTMEAGGLRAQIFDRPCRITVQDPGVAGQ